MRISTAQLFTQGLRAFGDQQTKLAQLQEQISTGNRLTKPSDDPAASARVLELQQTVELNEQYQVNINLAENRLRLEETALTGVENALLRMRELTLQANNASMNNDSRRAIAFEIDQLHEQILSLANTVDANGDYLFAGFQSNNQPFIDNTTGALDYVDFVGDQGERLLNISQSRQINVDTPGRETFMQINSAVGLSTVAGVANGGSGVVAPARVIDTSVYVPGDYEIVFTAPNTYDVVDLSGPVNIVTGATYSDSGVIDFQGIRTSITGTPNVGDTFSVSQAQYQDVFSIARNLSATLKDITYSDVQRAENFAQSLRDIDAAFGTMVEARTSIGGRLNALDAQRDDNDALIVATRETVSTLRDTDLAEAISQLTLEQTTLDAAQAVFARVTRSSLFNFLR